MAIIIGIDIRVLGNPHRSGIEEYTEQLLAHMLPLAPDVEFKLFFSSFRHTLSEYDWMRLPNVKMYRFGWPNRLLFLTGRLFRWPKLDRVIGGCDVFFSPHFLYAPLSRGVRRVTTFHDLSFEIHPEFFSWRRRFWHTVEMQPRAQAKLSDTVIAVSESTKTDVAHIYGISPQNIAVVYSGISPAFRRPSDDELEYFRRTKKLPTRFILTLAKLEPRKNIQGVIEAFQGLKRQQESQDLHLVIAGGRGWLYRDIFRSIRTSPHRDAIHVVGHVKDSERVYYYGCAEAFLYPAFFEGFGFPPLEAMACGTPVVTSNRTALPEVVGGAGLLVDPYNSDATAGGVEQLAGDMVFRAAMIQKGLLRARRFSWEKCAKETLGVLAPGM